VQAPESGGLRTKRFKTTFLAFFQRRKRIAYEIRHAFPGQCKKKQVGDNVSAQA
jgi:hypothetical protein